MPDAQRHWTHTKFMKLRATWGIMRPVLFPPEVERSFGKVPEPSAALKTRQGSRADLILGSVIETKLSLDKQTSYGQSSASVGTRQDPKCAVKQGAKMCQGCKCSVDWLQRFSWLSPPFLQKLYNYIRIYTGSQIYSTYTMHIYAYIILVRLQSAYISGEDLT